jgi:glycine dehydrogenase
MTMCHRLKGRVRNIFFVSETCHPQNIEVIQTRATALGIEVVVGDHEPSPFTTRSLARSCNIRTPGRDS